KRWCIVNINVNNNAEILQAFILDKSGKVANVELLVNKSSSLSSKSVLEKNSTYNLPGLNDTNATVILRVEKVSVNTSNSAIGSYENEINKDADPKYLEYILGFLFAMIVTVLATIVMYRKCAGKCSRNRNNGNLTNDANTEFDIIPRLLNISEEKERSKLSLKRNPNIKGTNQASTTNSRRMNLFIYLVICMAFMILMAEVSWALPLDKEEFLREERIDPKLLEPLGGWLIIQLLCLTIKYTVCFHKFDIIPRLLNISEEKERLKLRMINLIYLVICMAFLILMAEVSWALPLDKEEFLREKRIDPTLLESLLG
ncbi:hypothetical protein Bpfe_003564, partial [Biomphalaria pfeifferi]